jgi:hypothetical protein
MYDFNFTPKREDELVDLLEEGDGDYEVTAAEAQTSKAGNPMIKLSLKVWDKNCQEKYVYDYLILNNVSKFSLRKIRHFCYSNGMADMYEAGRFSAADCVGKAGRCAIGIQHDKEGKYPPKNVINDYSVNNNSTESAPKKSGMDVPQTTPALDAMDDDIPF